MTSTDRAAELLEKVETEIREEATDEAEEMRMDPDNVEAKEMYEMYSEDADDYRDIAILMRGGQADDAYEKWDGLDTASRDYLVDYLDDEEEQEVMTAFGDEEGS